MARSRELRVQIVGDTKNLGRALDKTGHQLGDLETRSARAGDAMKTAFKGAALAAGTLAVAGLGASVKAAIEAEKSQARLDAQLKAVGSSLRTQSDAVQDVIQKHSMLAGIDDEELQGAFGNLVRASGDVERSMKFVGLATDIARNRQMDVGKAAEIVGKVMGGNVGILSRYGFVMKEGATATEALGLLQKRFAGQAEAYGKTTEGQYQRLRVTLENLGEKIGAKLLPHLVNASKFLLRFLNQMENGTGTGGRFAKNVTNVANAIGDMVRWIRNAIRNTNAWGDATRQNIVNTWRNVQRVFGNVMAGVFRGFEKLFDLGSKIPGKVGDNFDKAQAAAGRAAKSVDRLGERVRNLPDKKQIKIQVSTLLDDFNAGKVPKLFPMGSGRPTTEDMMGGLDGAVKGQAKRFFKDNASKIGPLPFLGGLGTKGAAGVDAFTSVASRFGLSMTSGFRGGDPGFHGLNRARDYSNGTAPTPEMMAFAQYMARTFGSRLKELIYTPLGFSIDNGVRTAPFAQADHYDHVHVAMQRGGVLPGSRTGDRVPALLEEGEGIINRKAVRAMGGAKAINAINSAIPRFQGGGLASLNRIFPEHGLGEPGFTMSFDAVRRVFEASGADPRTAYIFATIAKGESGLRPGIRGDDPGGTKGRGLVQMTPGAWGYSGPVWEWIKAHGGERALNNPFINAKAALKLLEVQGWGAWYGTRYKHDPGPGVESALTKGDRRFMAGGGKADTPSRPKRSKPTVRARRGSTSSYEIDIAQADRRLSRFDDSEGAPGKVETLRLMQKAQLLATRRQRIKTRLRTINKALQGKLKPATRNRLKSEKAALIGELGQVESDWRATGERLHATTPAAEAGDAGDGGDPNQPLIDAMAAAAEAQRQNAEALQSLKDEVRRQNEIATSTLGIGYREATKALADVISGQIAGYTNQRARSAGDGVVGARY